MRFFIALDIPEQNQLEIQKIQQQIAEIIPQIRLTDPEKLHVTITFLGNQPEDLQQKLELIIKNAAMDIPPFELTPGYIDGFPSLHNPGVLWIGVKDEIDKLVILQERIKDSLTQINEPVDQRRYIPHIAIAKLPLRNITPEQEHYFETIMQQQIFSPIKITSIQLYESFPNGGFHKHNTLAEIKLIDKKSN